MGLPAHDSLINCSFHFFLVANDKILFKLACNEDKHNILNFSQVRPLIVELAVIEHLKSH